MRTQLLALSCFALVAAHVPAPVARAETVEGEMLVFRSTDGSPWSATLRGNALSGLARLKYPRGNVSYLAGSPDGKAIAYTR